MNDVAYPGIDGFLGTRASLMLDVLVLAMFAVLLILSWSIYQVKLRRRYHLHKWTQITLGAAVLVVVILFETDIRLHGWKSRAVGAMDGQPTNVVLYSLYVHLVFSVTTIVLWPITIFLAWRYFPNPPRPGWYSRIHKPLAWTAAIDMVMTAVTGWVFYWLAFVS